MRRSEERLRDPHRAERPARAGGVPRRGRARRDRAGAPARPPQEQRVPHPRDPRAAGLRGAGAGRTRRTAWACAASSSGAPTAASRSLLRLARPVLEELVRRSGESRPPRGAARLRGGAPGRRAGPAARADGPPRRPHPARPLHRARQGAARLRAGRTSRSASTARCSPRGPRRPHAADPRRPRQAARAPARGGRPGLRDGRRGMRAGPLLRGGAGVRRLGPTRRRRSRSRGPPSGCPRTRSSAARCPPCSAAAQQLSRQLGFAAA